MSLANLRVFGFKNLKLLNGSALQNEFVCLSGINYNLKNKQKFEFPTFEKAKVICYENCSHSLLDYSLVRKYFPNVSKIISKSSPIDYSILKRFQTLNSLRYELFNAIKNNDELLIKIIEPKIDFYQKNNYLQHTNILLDTISSQNLLMTEILRNLPDNVNIFRNNEIKKIDDDIGYYFGKNTYHLGKIIDADYQNNEYVIPDSKGQSKCTISPSDLKLIEKLLSKYKKILS